MPRRFLDTALPALDNAVMDFGRHDRRFAKQSSALRAALSVDNALRIFVLIASLAVLFCDGAVTRAADILPPERVIERIPRTAKELDAAHDKSQFACVLLPAGEPLAPARFEPDVKIGEPKQLGNSTAVAALPPEAGRWPALSFGVDMTKDDKADLPRLSRRAILDKISSNYVCLQVRVERAPAVGDPYLHFQPLAAVGGYGRTERTEKFASLQQSAVSNVRSLGLFLKPGEPRQADNLRTLVLSTKGSRVVAGDTSDPPRLEPSLELIFVRLRVAQAKSDTAAPPAIELHTFSTTDDLKRLVYVAPYAAPEKLAECGMTSTIRLTEYAYAGQYPSARATRGFKFQSRGRFDMSELDNYARDAGLKGTAMDNLTDVLDAVIDGRLKPRAE